MYSLSLYWRLPDPVQLQLINILDKGFQWLSSFYVCVDSVQLVLLHHPVQRHAFGGKRWMDKGSQDPTSCVIWGYLLQVGSAMPNRFQVMGQEPQDMKYGISVSFPEGYRIPVLEQGLVLGPVGRWYAGPV